MERRKGYTKFKDKHKGETCVLIAAGPGLSNIPVDLLKRYTSFGVNRIDRLFIRTKFIPTYYVDLGINHFNTLEQRQTIEPLFPFFKAAFVNRLKAHLFEWDEVYGILGTTYYGAKRNMMFFSFDPLHIIGVSPSVMYVTLQIAYYMGFSTALLVGMDHHYDLNSTYKHYYPDEDVPHWEKSPGHMLTPEQWYLEADTSFGIARKVWEGDGRRIVNLSTPTACTAFELGKVEEWV